MRLLSAPRLLPGGLDMGGPLSVKTSGELLNECVRLCDEPTKRSSELLVHGDR